MSLLEVLGATLQDGFWAGLAALGFAILFNVPPHALIACVACGAVGHAIRYLLITYTEFNIVPATLVGATAVGFMGLFFAYHYKMPSAVFTVSGAIPMVPGVFAFRTMISLLHLAQNDNVSANSDLINVGVNGITTGLVLGAIAVGIAAPTLLFNRYKPVPS